MRKVEIYLVVPADDPDAGDMHIVTEVEFTFDVTTEQLKSLAGLYMRECTSVARHNAENVMHFRPRKHSPTLHDFLKGVHPMPGSDPCITVVVEGLTFGIESDGYTHT